MADATGRIHPRFNQTVVVTWRLSSSQPNMQNLPYSAEARRPFIAEDGCVLLTVDYSQVDMRALAGLSQDPGLLEAFKNDEDIHRWMAVQLWGECDARQRHIIKSASYLAIYGGGAKGLHTYLNAPMGEFDLSKMGQPPSLGECEAIIRAYYDTFPGVATYQEGIRQLVRSQGYVEDYWGRRRYIQKVKNDSLRMREEGYREAVNMPIAGTAAGLFKLAMVRAAPVWLPIINIHDELVFEVPEARVEELRTSLGEAMTAVDFPCPLKVKSVAGHSLGDLLQ